MNDQRLNSTESRILEFFRENRGKSVSVEQIIERFYDGREQPEGARGSVLAFMRYFRLKCAANGLERIERTSRLGAGGSAEYRLVERDE